jgi:hypothetical protein
MDELTTHLLSEDLLRQLRPIVGELAQQEKEAQRLHLISQLLHQHMRSLIAAELGIVITPEQNIQLDITRGIIRI